MPRSKCGEVYLHPPNTPLWRDVQLKSTGIILPHLYLTSWRHIVTVTHYLVAGRRNSNGRSIFALRKLAVLQTISEMDKLGKIMLHVKIGSLKIISALNSGVVLSPNMLRNCQVIDIATRSRHILQLLSPQSYYSSGWTLLRGRGIITS